MTRVQAERQAAREGVGCDFPPEGARGCGTQSLYHDPRCAVSRRAEEILEAGRRP